ncbi:MAG TPA: SDR family oxidoreductase [Thermodesulfobacteriota bacterium]|nr:SDR family oxidoreductase [Thermodesulfobacteriota bacterium]
MRLKYKVAIITGSGSGIGKAAALMFAREGAKVIVADIDEAAAKKTVEEIKIQGGESTFFQVDVTKELQVKQMIDVTEERFGRLDVLFNNAGMQNIGSILEVKEEDWNKVFDVNVKSVFFCSRHAVPLMIRNGGGSIINVSSVAGVVGVPKLAAYCAAKGAVALLTKNMALDLASHKIRVNCLVPGTTLTPLIQDLLKTDDTEEKRRARLAKYPIGRYGNPEDIAAAALFLASDEASFITGSSLVVDGGMTAM